MANPSFDPRHWNIVVGATLVLGCAGRSISVEGEESSGPTSDEVSDESGTGPECVVNADCPTYFECVDNVCEYIGYVDTLDFDHGYEWDEGYEWVDEGYEYNYPCFDDWDCPEYNICDFEQCIPVGSRPPDCGLEAPIPRVLEPGVDVLGLTFVDFDADGRDELAVATQDDFLIYSADSDVPLVVPRPAPSSAGQIIGGAFDLDPGEDLVVNDPGDGLMLYSSNTIDAFIGPMLIPGSDAYLTRTMLAGDVDGAAPDDLVLVTNTGVETILGDGNADAILLGEVVAADMLDRSHADTGIGASAGTRVFRFGLDATSLGEESMGASELVTWLDTDVGVVVGAEPRAWGWHWLRGLELQTGAFRFETVLPFAEELDLRAAGLDPDQRDEVIAQFGPDWIALWLDAPWGCLLDLQLAVPPPSETHLSVGDHDGDGDEEFALRLAGGAVAILDYEG